MRLRGLLTCNPFNVLPPHSNDTQKVIDTHCTFVLFSPVFATRKSRPALPASLPFTLSFHSSLFFSEVCSLFSVTAVSQPFVYQSLRHSFHRDGGSHPSSQELCALFASCCSPLPAPKPRRPLPLRAPKSRRINTYEISRKCCKQITYRISKFFRCNTYKKQGGRGVLWLTKHPMRMLILSDQRESKDLSSGATKGVYPERPSGAEGPLFIPKNDFFLIGRLNSRQVLRTSRDTPQLSRWSGPRRFTHHKLRFDGDLLHVFAAPLDLIDDR